MRLLLKCQSFFTLHRLQVDVLLVDIVPPICLYLLNFSPLNLNCSYFTPNPQDVAWY